MGCLVVAAASASSPAVVQRNPFCCLTFLQPSLLECRLCLLPQGGCSNAAYNLSAPFQGCQLVLQEETRPGSGRPVLLVQAPGFVGGAPPPGQPCKRREQWSNAARRTLRVLLSGGSRLDWSGCCDASGPYPSAQLPLQARRCATRPQPYRATMRGRAWDTGTGTQQVEVAGMLSAV